LAAASPLNCERAEVGAEAAWVALVPADAGRSAGVVVTAAGLHAGVATRELVRPVTARDVCLSTSPLSAVETGLEWWQPLVAGARVVVATARELQYPTSAESGSRVGAATVVDGPAVTMRAWAEAVAGCRYGVSQGGLDAGDVARWTAVDADGYAFVGPAEAGGCSLGGLVTADTVGTFGRPGPGGRVYVLDTRLRLQPVGVPGEVYVGGASIARGYCGRSGATAAGFVADPHGAPGARMVRTGMWARWTAAGTLDGVGPERETPLETACRAWPGVQDAVRVAGGAGAPPGVTPLYVVARGPIDWPALQQQLGPLAPAGTSLQLVPLAALPLTPFGTLDFLALPPATPITEERQIEAPRTDTEQFLLQIWIELLETGPISIHDTFFELGGHSLLIMTLLAQVYEMWGVEVSPVDFFAGPTIAELAATIDHASGVTALSRPDQLSEPSHASEGAKRS
jgi:hypothetical protein